MSILYFNPGHETAVLNASPYYMAPANVVAMQKELSFLPAWYGKEDDIVLVDNWTEYREYYDCIFQLFPSLPRPVLASDIASLPVTDVSFWGISPQAIHYFCEISHSGIKIPEWKDEYNLLHSRQTARECLRILVESVPEIEQSIIPQFHSSLESIEELVNSSSHPLLAKAPYSSSGRGLLWLPVTGLTRTERQILHGILRKQGSVSVEQVLEKDTDFAMEFILDNQGEISFEGYSLFSTNSKGSYLGNYLINQDDIIAQLTSKISSELLLEVQGKLTTILKERYASVYSGCVGVDMMIYLENGEYRLQPCLEINMRYNMGYLSTILYDKYIHPTSRGLFKIDFSSKEGDVFSFHQKNLSNHSLSFEDGKIQRGYLPLCPVTKESRYWAYILIED